MVCIDVGGLGQRSLTIGWMRAPSTTVVLNPGAQLGGIPNGNRVNDHDLSIVVRPRLRGLTNHESPHSPPSMKAPARCTM